MVTRQNKNIFDRLNDSIRESITIKLISMGILVLILLIPKSMINSLITERERRRTETEHEVSDQWARQQIISGPILSLPYRVYIHTKEAQIREEIKYATILPEQLHIDTEVEPEIRHRGIFKVVVYKSKVQMQGKFIKPDFESMGIRSADVLWDRAVLNLGISDLRGIEDQVFFKSKNQETAFQPGTSHANMLQSGIHLSAHDTPSGFINTNFDINLPIRGSESLYFIPVGKRTEVNMKSKWGDPSFDGAFLPKSHTVDQDHFDAHWQVLQYNRNYPQAWNADAQYNFNDSKFGVRLLVTSDHYQKSLRTSKYAELIISLTFLIFFIIEVTYKLRIHAFQYILIGLALLVFYTLLLSISEHAGYDIAYGVSALSVIALISFYATAILGKKRIAWLLAIALLAVYGFIFIIIQIETYALLVGSAGLFVILALTMYFTRHIKWYAHEEKMP